MPRLLAIEPRSNFRLSLRYSDGVVGVVDLSDLAGRGAFASWNERGNFDKVHLENGAPCWENGADLCPDMLYLRLTGKHPDELFPALSRAKTHA